MDVDIPPLRRARGFTLIELATTTAVISISLTLLVPDWSNLSHGNRITQTANTLLSDLRYARSTAVTRNRDIGLCPTEDRESCSKDPFGWQQGYLIFEDTDGNRERSAEESLLHVQDEIEGGLRLHTTAGRPVIRFKADGAAWGTNATFSICSGRQESAYRAVVLYGSGRARVDRRAPGNRPIRCS